MLVKNFWKTAVTLSGTMLLHMKTRITVKFFLMIGGWFVCGRWCQTPCFSWFFKNSIFLKKNFNQHKVTTANWKNVLPWHVPQKSVSFSRPDFKIFLLQFPRFKSCCSNFSSFSNKKLVRWRLKIKNSLFLLHFLALWTQFPLQFPLNPTPPTYHCSWNRFKTLFITILNIL